MTIIIKSINYVRYSGQPLFDRGNDISRVSTSINNIIVLNAFYRFN